MSSTCLPRDCQLFSLQHIQCVKAALPASSPKTNWKHFSKSFPSAWSCRVSLEMTNWETSKFDPFRIPAVSRIHPLGTMNICMKFPCKPSHSRQGIYCEFGPSGGLADIPISKATLLARLKTPLTHSFLYYPVSSLWRSHIHDDVRTVFTKFKIRRKFTRLLLLNRHAKTMALPIQRCILWLFDIAWSWLTEIMFFHQLQAKVLVKVYDHTARVTTELRQEWICCWQAAFTSSTICTKVRLFSTLPWRSLV